MYRNGLIVSFSITIALIYGQTLGEFNPQQSLVARAMASAIILTTTSVSRIRALEYYRRTKEEKGFTPYPTEPAPGTLGWLMTILTILSLVVWVRGWLVFEFSSCGQYLLNPAETVAVRVMIYTVLVLTTIANLVRNVSTYKLVFKLGEPDHLRVRYIYIIITLWAIVCSLELVIAEYGLYVEQRYDDNLPTAGGTSPQFWGIGQVLALVMLALPVWDIGAYYCVPHKKAIHAWPGKLRFLPV